MNQVRYGNKTMMAVDADGLAGRLARAGDHWQFQVKGDPQAIAYRVRHDDLSFTREDGVQGMLLSGLNGHFFRTGTPATGFNDDHADWPEDMNITLDADALAALYTGPEGEAILDHSPQVLGLAEVQTQDQRGD